ncbi:AAA domain-containing protein [Rossellomorea marisflavi]|uniref:AAA domain-containing protein n=1 Tax=Rossellomorea marisflavi TaxID=189381 RepID=A0A5D4S0H8_9BACI|nr:ATP-dependent Clp protease ATP-binding subunit [Rossellomorea marisflavi]KQU63808.1 ATP-dependent Clp protease ATP-binding subunit [Bacillus sp. Leaf406]TYS55376.1 AAA domain-containing protein [Rossellomorea marisflavi]UKS66628.1 AAA family ATPase [Rossellomorea marisflavi]
MKCEVCQQHQATIELFTQVNGTKSKVHMCSTCFQQQTAPSGMHGGFPFDELFKGMNIGGSQQSGFKSGQGSQPQTQQRGGGLLDQFGRNVTDGARAGLIDPVIGRDKEVDRVIEILNRRNKNNPVLIGEPGVGKTAIAEGLALKIIAGDVPSKLMNKEVYVMDVASLTAGTGVRGSFEERLKGIINELQNRKNVMLFIDEIHQLVGAGSAEGSMDAGNILKPALARGELQVIGATTLKEYRQIEKDAALERRFQPVMVNEPTLEESIEILKGLKDKYEAYHKVTFTDEALEACVKLSHRYIQDRFLPDKAIDLMDEAGSKVNLLSEGKDTAELHQKLSDIKVKKEQATKAENYEEAARLRDQEAAIEKQLDEGHQTHDATVETELIQSLVESKTGIPVGKLQSDDRERMKSLEENLAGKVIGQEEAVKKVAKAIRRSRAGLKAKHRPIGTFLFVGPTGVGKTELTKTLAEELFGSKEAMLRLDMSEYMEKHSVSKLIGSPPGYVGHEESGQLTEKVRRNPYSIILLDEIEKAHPDVQHMFLQILEDGRLTDSQGRTVSFKDAVIIMTSNAGVTDVKEKVVGFDTGGTDAIKETNILTSLGAYFKPEFLNRFDSIIQFQSLEKEELLTILDLMLDDLRKDLSEQGISITVDTVAKEKLVDLGYHPAFGARPLRRVIQEQVEDRIADLLLEEDGVKEVNVSVKDDNIIVGS